MLARAQITLLCTNVLARRSRFCRPSCDDRSVSNNSFLRRACITACRQGFSIPGTVSSDFKKAELHSWRQSFYDRLAAHARRAAATVAEEHEGTVTKELPGGAPASSAEALRETVAAIAEGCPKVVAFAGKRQASAWFYTHDESFSRRRLCGLFYGPRK